MNRRALVVVLMVSIYGVSLSQNSQELSIYLGNTGFLGDVGSTDILNFSDPFVGLIYRYHLDDQVVLRADATFSEISADDRNSEDRKNRNTLRIFNTSFFKAFTGLEFNFLNVYPEKDRLSLSPYISSGVSYNSYGVKDIETGVQEPKFAIGIPVILGIRLNAFKSIMLSSELGFNYLFTDDLDGSDQGAFGNPNSNDWHTFLGVSLGFKPKKIKESNCYCN